jgi:hypothetical protein
MGFDRLLLNKEGVSNLFFNLLTFHLNELAHRLIITKVVGSSTTPAYSTHQRASISRHL